MSDTSFTLDGQEGYKLELPSGLFINNEFIPSMEALTLDVENPTTGKKLATIASAGVKDVNVAVEAAKAALPGWKATLPQQRAKHLIKLAELIESPEHAKDFTLIDSLDSGMAAFLRNSQLKDAAENLRYFAGWADKITGKTLDFPGGQAYTVKQPIGVCAAIIPWNTPLMIAMWKIAPALATGNVLILKTPELSPLFGIKLAQLVKEAGFPAGVLNIIVGEGSVAGQALAEHHEIWKVSFTGSTATGRKILAASARSNLKRVNLELGGKGPSIVFDDAELNNALFWTSTGITLHNGQICAAGSRIYVQEGIYDKFIAGFKTMLEQANAGAGQDLSDPTVVKAPIISKGQFEKVLGYIEEGRSSGAELLTGGNKIGDAGYYVENTAFTNVGPNDKIMKEEIFGPVAAIAKFKSEEEAIAAANDSDYGLNAAVFSSNADRLQRVSEALEVGTVTQNTWGLLATNQPFGGIKSSGFGRDMGEEALDGWLNVKTIKRLAVQPPA